MQLGKLDEAFETLMTFHPKDLEQRAYLYYGAIAEYHILKNEKSKAINSLEEALKLVKNEAEKTYLKKKKERINEAM